MSMGKVCLWTIVNYTLWLHNVRFAPNLHLNLISVSTLDEQGYYCSFGDKVWKLTRSNLVLVKGAMKNNLYISHVKLWVGWICLMIHWLIYDRGDLDTWVWKVLIFLPKKKLLPLIGTHLTTCTHCLAIE